MPRASVTASVSLSGARAHSDALRILLKVLNHTGVCVTAGFVSQLPSFVPRRFRLWPSAAARWHGARCTGLHDVARGPGGQTEPAYVRTYEPRTKPRRSECEHAAGRCYGGGVGAGLGEVCMQKQPGSRRPVCADVQMGGGVPEHTRPGQDGRRRGEARAVGRASSARRGSKRGTRGTWKGADEGGSEGCENGGVCAPRAGSTQHAAVGEGEGEGEGEDEDEDGQARVRVRVRVRVQCAGERGLVPLAAQGRDDQLGCWQRREKRRIELAMG